MITSVWGLAHVMAEISGKIDGFGHLERKLETFSPQFIQKITGLGIWNRFGTDLAVQNIWLFGRLGGQNELW